MKQNYVVVGTCQRLLRQVLLALRSMPKANCMVIGGENTHNLKWSSLCSENIILNFDRLDQRNDDKLFVNKVNSFARQFPNAVLIPADCEGTRMINRTKESLRIRTIPHADMATLDTLDNKWQFFQFCSAHDIRVPATVYVGDKSRLDFSALASQLGLPFVVKPVNQAGSTGVHIVPDEAFFNEAIRDNEAYRFDTLIAQKYIPGFDLCFNFFAVGGEISAFTVQKREGSQVRFLSHPSLEALGRRLAKASAYNGVMCIDARVDAHSGEVYLIESNPRFWASLGASVWCGVNFVLESIHAERRPHAPRTITTGIFHERHPVLRPSAWKRALFDLGEQGRIIRANLRDLPMVTSAIRTLPANALRQAMRRSSPR